MTQNECGNDVPVNLFQRFADDWADLMSVYPKAPNNGAFEAYMVAIKGGFSPSLIYRAAKHYREEVRGKHPSKIKQLTNFLNPGPDQYLYWYWKQIETEKIKSNKEKECLICGHRQNFGTSILCSFCGCPGGDSDTDQETIDYWKNVHKEKLNGGTQRDTGIPQGWNKIIQDFLAEKSKRRSRSDQASSEIDRIINGH